MALEWSTDINFAGLFKRKPRNKQEFPSKTYINLIIPDEHEIRGMRLVVTSIVAAIAIGLFVKFGVYDFFARVMEKNRILAERTEELHELNMDLVDYDTVLETYRMYEASRMTDEAGDLALIDVFSLVDRRILPLATIDSFHLKNNTLSLGVANIDLDKVGELVGHLYEEKTVSSVSVTTASSARQTNEKNNVLLTINLRSSAAADAEEAEKAESSSINQGEATAGE